MRTPSLLVAAIAVTSFSVHATPPKFSIAEIGTGQNSSYPRALNNKGQVVGPILHEGQTAISLYLPTPDYGLPAGANIVADPGRNLSASDINDSGTIVGTVIGSAAPRGSAFIYSQETFTELFVSGINAISNNGFLAGLENVPDNRPGTNPDQDRKINGFLRNPGHSTLLHPIVRVFDTIQRTEVVDVNSSGNAAANIFVFSKPRGALYNGSSYTLFGPEPPDVDLSRAATSINEKSQIVGISGDRAGERECYIYLPAPDYGLNAGYHVLFPTEGAPVINDHGQILTNTHLWDQGRLHPLSELLPDDDPLTYFSVYDFNNAGTGLALARRAAGTPTFLALLQPQGTGMEITVEPGRPLKTGELAVATVKLTHRDEDPATYTFPSGLLAIDPEEALELEYLEPVPPFTLSLEDPSREFAVRFTAIKRGFATLRTHVVTEGPEPKTIEAEKEVLVSPLALSFKITPEKTLLNQTPDDKLGARARAYNLERQQMSPPLPRLPNLVEIEMTVTNESEFEITDLNVPEVLWPFVLISNTDLNNRSVPLTPVRLYPPGADPIDLTAPDPAITVENVDLAPGEAAVFVWLMDAFDSNPEPTIDNSTDLEFRVLVRGGLDGKSVQAAGIEEFSVIDRPLLEWGIRPKDGRTNYLSGTLVRATGTIENISTRDGREPQDIRVMIYQLPEGNLGGGFMFEASKAGMATPTNKEPGTYYEIFELPGEGPGKKLDLEAIFLSMPTVLPAQGKVKYGVRLWVLEDDAEAPGGKRATNADGQKIVKEGWGEEFDVTYTPNRAEFTRQEECYLLGEEIPQLSGIWPFLCGMNEGILIEFTGGAIGLGQFMLSGGEQLLNAGAGILAWEYHTFGKVLQATLGSEEAKKALIEELYVQYRTFVELGVMAGEAGSQIPFAIEKFELEAVKVLADTFRLIETGNIKELQFQLGKQLGANPDFLLEPLVVARTYQKSAKALIKLDADVVANTMRTEMRLENARQATSLEQRLKDAVAAGKSPASALLPGDFLSDSKLLDIYGITREQKKAIQKIAKENNVTITFRSRNPESVRLLDSKQAYPKPQELKHKTVNNIDIEFLGYRGDAKAKLEIVEPPAALLGPDGRALTGDQLEAAVKDHVKQFNAKINGNAVLEKEVRERFKLRAEEWNDLVLRDMDPSKAGKQSNSITTNFDAAAQEVPGKARDRVKEVGASEVRTVTYEPVPGSDPRAWEMKMTDGAGKQPRFITGDVDFMAILDESGGLIRDIDKRIEIYTQLATLLDMQHGESFTFFIQEVRAKYLKAASAGTEGAEAVVAISGLGDQKPVAALFVDNLSIIDNPGCPNAAYLPKRKKLNGGLFDFILRPGEVKTVRRADPSGEFILLYGIPISTKPPLDLLSRIQPETLGERLRAFLNSPNFILPSLLLRLFEADDKEVVFSRDEEGQVIQAVPDPSNPLNFILRAWTEAGGWQTLTMAEALAIGDPNRLELSPMTSIPGGGGPTDRRVEITPQSALGALGGFFQAGDRVVLNPGAPNQRIATVRSLGSLIFTNPLGDNHLSGEMVASLGPDTTDRDSDNLTGFEEVAIGTDPDNPDTDFDGIPDGVEVLSGFDPLDPASGFTVTGLYPSGPNDSNTTIKWRGHTGRRYVIEVSPSLLEGSWNDVETVTGTEGLEQIREFMNPPVDADRLFYRVRLLP